MGGLLLKWVQAASVAFFMIIVVLYVFISDFRMFIHEASTQMFEGDIQSFKDFLLTFGVWAPIISCFLMIVAIVIFPPVPAFAVTFANGLIFGFFWGALLSWASAMLGAAMAFFIARSLGEPVLKWFFSSKLLQRMDQFIVRYGTRSILLTRLIPVFSFALVSYAAGLTSIRFMGYMLATGIGQAPATLLYSYLGEQATGSIMYIFWTFVVVICLGILATFFKSKFRMFRL